MAERVDADLRQQNGVSVPLVVLQGIKPLLALQDMRLARLVCKDWAGELAASVHGVQLPPELWQSPATRQEADLQRLVETYWSFKHAHLRADGQVDADAEAVARAARTLARIAALRSVAVSRLGGGNPSWAAVLAGLALLPEGMANLELRDVRLPGPGALDGLASLHNIRRLELHTGSSSKLQQDHVDAVARMAQLRSLSLSFRAVNGTLCEPLTLDCLGQLSRLTHLEIRYTGMTELSTGLGFACEELLAGCRSLSSLLLSRVPTASLRGLFRLEQLRELSLLPIAPLAEHQARSLALCSQLRRLTLENMPLELLPQLAPLTGLESLDVAVWNPPGAGGQDMPGGHNLLSLGALTGLTSLALTGPVMVATDELASLAAAMPRLASLGLAATLLDGAAGLAAFRSLEALRLRPWSARCSRRAGEAGLGGFDEAPLNGQRGITVAVHDLPPGLRRLEGQELLFAPSGSDGVGIGSTAADDATPALREVHLRYSPDTPDQLPPPLPSAAVCSSVASLELRHPHIGSQQLADVLGSCAASLTRLAISTADNLSQLSKPLSIAEAPNSATAAGPRAAQAASGAAAGARRASSCGGSSGGSSSAGGATGAGKRTLTSCFYSAAAAAGAAAAAAAAAATPVAAVAGVQVSGMAVATVAATAGMATASALSRHNSLSLPRSGGGAARPTPAPAPGSGSGAGGSSRGPPPPPSSGGLGGLQSMGSFGLPSMGSFSLQSMGSASLASLISDALGVGGSGAGGSAASGLSGMGRSLGDGLATLGRCGALEELQLVVGERVLARASVRAAIAGLPNLRKLSLAVASDAPAAAARDLGAWVAGLRSLEWVAVGLEGPGAGEALATFADRVSAGLPACKVHTLKPAPAW